MAAEQRTAVVARLIRDRGGVLSYRALDALGVSRQDVRRALESGTIRRVRTRWFAVGDAPGDVVRAVRVGGSLTAASLARLSDLWVLADPVLHVRVPRTASRLLAPDDAGGPAPELTPREVEILRWTMDGKTAWEVGELLGISERTAVLHLNNGMHKLDCTNKHQAVLKALRLGLIR